MPASSSSPANQWHASRQSRFARYSPNAVLSLRRTIAELVVRYDAGEDTVALSREYGISKTGLWKLLAEGVSLRLRPIPPQDAELAVQLYESALTIRQVVAKFVYSYGTIRIGLNKKRVAMR